MNFNTLHSSYPSTLRVATHRMVLFALVAAVVAAVVFACPAWAAPPEWLAITDVRVHSQSNQGVLENATVLIRNGKITEVGTHVKVPVSADVVDGRGKELVPGFVGIFRPIELRQEAEAETRTVTIGGRSFTTPGRAPSNNTNFVRVADVLSTDAIDWRGPIRSGITTLHIAVPGYCQTAVIQPGADLFTSTLLDPKHQQLLITLTNNSQSLDLLRNALKGNERTTTAPPGSTPTSGRRGPGGPGGPPSGAPTRSAAVPPRTAGETANQPIPEPTLEQKLWSDVRDGKSPLWINVNNAATVLHALLILKEYPKVQVVWIANGSDVYQTLNEFPKDTTRLVLSPRIDLIPNTRVRINVPAIASKEKRPLALSLGVRATDLLETQAAPTFGLAMLAKTGLGEEEALRAVTLEPAKFLGLDQQVGSIEAGKLANLVLFDGSPFEAATSISQVFLEGRPVHEK